MKYHTPKLHPPQTALSSHLNLLWRSMSTRSPPPTQTYGLLHTHGACAPPFSCHPVTMGKIKCFIYSKDWEDGRDRRKNESRRELKSRLNILVPFSSSTLCPQSFLPPQPDHADILWDPDNNVNRDHTTLALF